jgi:hypothetical protein
MAIIQAINTYSLNIPVNSSNVRGVLSLFCANGWKVTVQFQEAAVLPANQLNLVAKSMLAFAHADSYLKAVDLIRNEKPDSILINELAAPATLNIITGNEPVGEAE